jgi:hypothetical protein
VCVSHGWRGWCYLPRDVNFSVRVRAVGVGLVMMWRDRLGRLQWFRMEGLTCMCVSLPILAKRIS